jgi:hypothetical protein
MVAAALIATSIVVLIPIIAKNTPADSLRQATEMISQSVLLSRQKAVAGETRYRIKYNEKSFQIYREEADGAWQLDPPENRFELPDDVLISPTTVPSDGWVLIDSAGEIGVGISPVLLRLRDQKGSRMSIRISQSGHVQEFTNW